MWLIFLFSLFISGYSLSKLFVENNKSLITIASSYILGSFFGINILYFLRSYLIDDLSKVILVYFILSLIFFYFSVIINSNVNLLLITARKIFDSKSFVSVLFIFFLSWIIFSKTFSYDNSSGVFLIASNVYGDFGAHIPFIRSFSLGSNFPAEVPFFANNSLVYHFMFDLYAGILEYLGLRIDLAFNLIGALSFTFLVIMIYELALGLFKKRLAALLTVFLFLFNSSFAFINFFMKNGLNFSLPLRFWHQSSYVNNGPLGENTIGVFWNINTYLNQRQFVFGALMAVFIIYVLLLDKKQKNLRSYKSLILLGVLIGLLPFWHMTVFISMELLLIALIVFYPKLRKNMLVILIASSIISLPEVFLISSHSTNSISFNPGFSLATDLSLKNIILFWVWNLGLTIPLMIYGFIHSEKFNKKLFFCFFLLFLIPNLFRFGKDIFDNHKFFNLWIIFANMYVASALTLIFSKNIRHKFLALVFTVFLVLSGVINLMVIKNDVMTRIADYPKNSLMTWASRHLSKNAVIVTNGEIYDPMSLIGRKTIIGRPHHVFTYGGNPDNAVGKQEKILMGLSSKNVREIIVNDKIDYIIIYKKNFAKNSKSYSKMFLDNNFKKVYDDEYGTIYKT